MNALHRLIRQARQDCRDELEHDAELSYADSRPIRLRNGDTLQYRATRGKRGGITITSRRIAGWLLDHPADFGEASY